MTSSDFAQHLEVRRHVEMRARRDVRPADHDRLAARMAQFDQAEAVGLLEEHAAGHDHVGPVDVGGREVFGIAVDEPEFPVLRQQRGDRDQAERGGRIARADELAGSRVAPERIRHELRIDEQDAVKCGQSLSVPLQDRMDRRIAQQNKPDDPAKQLPSKGRIRGKFRHLSLL